MTPIRQIAIFIIMFLTTSVVSSETLRFVYSDDDPPISSQVNNIPVGLFPELVELIFSLLQDYDVSTEAYPWSRSQLLVESGERDGFVTYPSKHRKQYAVFSEQAVFIQDYGYLIYHKDNTHKTRLEWAKSFKDISDLTVIMENGSEWEKDNIPSFLNRVKAVNQDTMVHLLFLRKEGDFMVMPPETAVHLTRKLGYQKVLNYNSVKFINDSLIPFHIGLSKKTPNADIIINQINKIILSTRFSKARKAIIEQYH